ncbi:MAG: hypothetical protein J5497_00640, partial [Selenomonadaceae bacterium]|nr:hypothetical protein [Selenomonadaceae bacterium]
AELNVANSKLTSLSNAQGDLIIRVRTNGVVTGEVRIVGGIKHPPKFTFGESNASGGISGDGNGGSSSGNGGGNGGGNDGGKTSGGKSTSEGINSEATVGKSAVGSTGKNTSTETGGNDKPRNIPSTSKNYPSVGNKRASVEGEFHNLSDVLNRWANSVQENTENTVETGITNFGVITGTENADLLSAPEVGSTLWGGSDNVSDTLVGNVGADVLIGGKTQGADFFLNTSSADVIYLNDTTLNDIIGAGENNGIITLLFDNGNFVNVQSTEALSPSFILSDGTSYRYDNTTKSWGVTQYVYPGNNMTISDYESDKSILFRADYAGAFFDDAGNFVAYSSTGALIVQNAADKVININDYAGNPCFKAYAASTSGVIDGRGISGFEIINGSAGADMIYAGDGGSQLWGGFGDASDTLIGGGGTDIFIGGKNQGVDLFLNASSADIVHLNDATLSDIVATEENNGAIAVAFNNGNVIAAQSSEVISATFMLADGSAYRFNHVTKSWQTA